MPTVEIANLKHLNRLTFNVPGPGVHLLCGGNGSGKSSLLAALHRIGWPNAFAHYFRTSAKSNVLDRHDGANVKYTAGNRSVSYWYGGQKWAPSPKANTDVLNQFGYTGVLFIGANSSRIEPRPEDFRPQRVRDAPQSIRDAAEVIFSDPKFRELKCINVRKGTGAEAFLLLDKARITKNNNARNYYFSERSFSLGELCVLKLVRTLESCDNNALVLIDELELALHPAAQLKLLRYLEVLAGAKTLTVIFSTHSASLVKAVKRSQIIALCKTDSGIDCVAGAYPAFALQTMATGHDVVPDRAIFVEDDQAKAIVDIAVRKLLATRFTTQVQPTTVVVPIGGFMQVVEFLDKANSILPPGTSSTALLDQDVAAESLRNMRQGNNLIALAKFQRVEGRVSYLPWTPEVGIAEMVIEDIGSAEREIRTLVGDQRIDLRGINWAGLNGLAAGVKRDTAKTLVRALTNEIARHQAISADEAKRFVTTFFVERIFQDQARSAEITQLLMPLLR